MLIKQKKTKKRKIKTKFNWKIKLIFWLLCLNDHSQILRTNTDRTLSVPIHVESGNQTLVVRPLHNLKINLLDSNTITCSAILNQCFQLDGKIDCRKSKNWSHSSKYRNKQKKILNGNIPIKKNVTAIHWNMGAKFWHHKKLEIEAITQIHQPELFCISEANQHVNLNEQENAIPGYYQILPKSQNGHNIARIVLLVKDGLAVKVLGNLMQPAIANIWIKIGDRGKKPITFGFIYREHQHIGLTTPDDSLSPQSQLERWRQIVNNWRAATNGGNTIIMGDLNLDFEKWGNPRYAHIKMVDLVKN